MRAASATKSEGGDAYTTAANTIHPGGAPASLVLDSSSDCTNISMAQKIATFFSVNGSGCDIIPLSENTTTYFNTASTSPNKLGAASFQYYYTTTWKEPTFGYNAQGMSAYRPGARQGVDPSGNSGSPFTGSTLLAKRNFYSTKFIPVRLVTAGSDSYSGASGIGIFLDPSQETGNTNSDLFGNGFPMRNTIDTTELEAYGSPPPF